MDSRTPRDSKRTPKGLQVDSKGTPKGLQGTPRDWSPVFPPCVFCIFHLVLTFAISLGNYPLNDDCLQLFIEPKRERTINDHNYRTNYFNSCSLEICHSNKRKCLSIKEIDIVEEEILSAWSPLFLFVFA